MHHVKCLSAATIMALLTGCAGAPSSDGNSNGGGNNNGNANGSGTQTVAEVINFETASGFPQGETNVTFEIQGVDVPFTGGEAATRGIPALYSDGSRSWLVSAANGMATIDLSGLSVVSARFYFVHVAGDGTSLTWTDSNGDTSDPISSVEAVTFADPNGFVTIDAPNGATIQSIDVTPPTGDDEAAIDTLRLTIELSS